VSCAAECLVTSDYPNAQVNARTLGLLRGLRPAPRPAARLAPAATHCARPNHLP
jgi:hypothetical protein